MSRPATARRRDAPRPRSRRARGAREPNASFTNTVGAAVRDQPLRRTRRRSSPPRDGSARSRGAARPRRPAPPPACVTLGAHAVGSHRRPALPSSSPSRRGHRRLRLNSGVGPFFGPAQVRGEDQPRPGRQQVLQRGQRRADARVVGDARRPRAGRCSRRARTPARPSGPAGPWMVVLLGTIANATVRRCGVRRALGHVVQQVLHAVREAPLVVVPGEDLGQVAVDHLGERRVHDRRVRVAAEVDRDRAPRR